MGMELKLTLKTQVARNAAWLGMSEAEWVNRAVNQVLVDGLRDKRVTQKQRANRVRFRGHRT